MKTLAISIQASMRTKADIRSADDRIRIADETRSALESLLENEFRGSEFSFTINTEWAE